MKAKGFTLIELAVVLAIIAILAAILTPLVTQYVDEARITRAREETRQIAQGINLHLRDTGKYPMYATLASTGTDVETLISAGTTPTFTAWANQPTTSIQTRINTNFFSLPVTYGTGRVGYHGPYTVNIDSDPWGNAYVVEIGPATGSSLAAFVISSGPDGIIQTVQRQAPSSFVISNDDIVARIK